MHGWPTTLELVRHAESEGNVADRRAHEAGSASLDLDVRDADVPLSDTGRRQATALGQELRERDSAATPTAVLSSPYERALTTARLAVSALDRPLAVRTDERLRERDLGVFDGLTGLGIRERYAEESSRRSREGKFYYRPPCGESWCDVALRVRDVVRSLREDYAGERVLLVSHQAVIMLFRYVLEGLSEREILEIDRTERIANAAITRYESDGPALRLVSFNDPTPVAARGEPQTEEPDAESVAD